MCSLFVPPNAGGYLRWTTSHPGGVATHSWFVLLKSGPRTSSSSVGHLAHTKHPGGRGGDSNIKKVGVLVFSLRGCKSQILVSLRVLRKK